MNLQQIDEIDELRSCSEFFRNLSRKLRTVVDEAINAVHQRQVPAAGLRWESEVANGIFSEQSVRVSCLSGEPGIRWPSSNIRELCDATRNRLWQNYDGLDSAVLFVDLLPSANWAHPSWAVLCDLPTVGFHDERRLWYPIEPFPVGSGATEFRVIFELPTEKLQQ